MRVLLFTGKGGVGKTTASAATAALAASRGRKTLVLSTDPAHSLADALGVELGPEPTEIDTGLYGMQVDAQRAFERSWREVQSYLRVVLERAGVDALQAEELTVLPGAEEVLALLELSNQVASGRWDLGVVDGAQRPFVACIEDEHEAEAERFSEARNFLGAARVLCVAQEVAMRILQRDEERARLRHGGGFFAFTCVAHGVPAERR